MEKLYIHLKEASLSPIGDRKPSTKREFRASFIKRCKNHVVNDRLHRIRTLNSTLKVRNFLLPGSFSTLPFCVFFPRQYFQEVLYFCLFSQKRQIYKWSSRSWRIRRSPQTSSEGGRRPTWLWCRTSVRDKASRWQQRLGRLQRPSGLLLWWRPVYEPMLLGLQRDSSLTDSEYKHWQPCPCQLSFYAF